MPGHAWSRTPFWASASIMRSKHARSTCNHSHRAPARLALRTGPTQAPPLPTFLAKCRRYLAAQQAQH
eukprot:7342317-Lingulodinium_polyedra.AAC.1